MQPGHAVSRACWPRILSTEPRPAGVREGKKMGWVSAHSPLLKSHPKIPHKVKMSGLSDNSGLYPPCSLAHVIFLSTGAGNRHAHVPAVWLAGTAGLFTVA